jgi:hypothetical protein
MDIGKMSTEFKNADTGWSRAAFGSIIRRNYEEIKMMSTTERRKLIVAIGAPASYITEMYKELKGIEYDSKRLED